MILGHGVGTRTVLDLAGNAGTLPGALLQTLVAHKVRFANQGAVDVLHNESKSSERCSPCAR